MTTGEEVWKEKKHKRKQGTTGKSQSLTLKAAANRPLCSSVATLIGKKQLKLHKQYS